MNILADESVDKPIVDQLRQNGLLITYIAESNPGVFDDVVLELANKNSLMLLTADKDFGELVYRLRRATRGVILLRLSGLTAISKAKITSSAIKEHSAETENAFTVISPDSIRIRHAE